MPLHLNLVLISHVDLSLTVRTGGHVLTSYHLPGASVTWLTCGFPPASLAVPSPSPWGLSSSPFFLLLGILSAQF